jgi:two-component system chemotaxis sensor kinase CheA
MANDTNYNLLNDPDMKEIFESFIVESKEILEKLDLNLVDLEKHPQDTDLLNDVFRSFHTIKGTSGFLGLEKLTKLTHRAEDILNRLRKSEVMLNDEIMDGILLAFDSIKDLINHIELNKNEDINIQEAIDVLSKVQSGFDNVSNIEIPPKKTRKSLKKVSVKKDPEKSVQAVQELVEVEEKPEEIIEEPEQELSEATYDDRILSKQEKLIEAAHKKGDNTIRVDVERLDEFCL